MTGAIRAADFGATRTPPRTPPRSSWRSHGGLRGAALLLTDLGFASFRHRTGAMTCAGTAPSGAPPERPARWDILQFSDARADGDSMESTRTRARPGLRARRRATAASIALLVGLLLAPGMAAALELRSDDVLAEEVTTPLLEPVEEVLGAATAALGPVDQIVEQQILAPVEGTLEPVEELLGDDPLTSVDDAVGQVVDPLPLVPELLADPTPSSPSAAPAPAPGAADAVLPGDDVPDSEVAEPASTGGTSAASPPGTSAGDGGPGGTVATTGPSTSTSGAAETGPGEVVRPPPLAAFAAEAAEEFRFPLLLMAAVILFLLLSNQLVPRDRKALARATDDPGLGFS
jgi:hypothetical protein